MSITITQSNKKDYIGRDFLFHLKKDQIIIGNKILGMGKKFEISCNDVKEFKVLDENSNPIKETSGLKKNRWSNCRWIFDWWCGCNYWSNGYWK